MFALIGRIVVIAVVCYLVYRWWRKPQPGDISTFDPQPRRVDCLPSTHPVNYPEADVHYVQHWYQQHDFANELAIVSAYGSEQDIRIYMDHLSHWMQKATFKTDSRG